MASDNVIEKIVVLVLGALVIIGLVLLAKSIGAQEIFFKQAAAKDVAFMLDTLHALPGDVYLNYPQDLKGYGISIAGDKVEVFGAFLPIIDTASQSYNFAGMEGIAASGSISKANNIVINKKDREIKIEQEKK